MSCSFTYISKVSFLDANWRQNFNGVFRVVNRVTDEDREQRHEVTTIHAIYHPNKFESEKEIKKAMSEYNARHAESGSGMVPDGGVDSNGKPTMTQRWSYSTFYTCTRGDRLPY